MGGLKTKSNPFWHITTQERSVPILLQARAPFLGGGYKGQDFSVNKTKNN